MHHSLGDTGQVTEPSRDFSMILNYTLKCFPLLFIIERSLSSNRHCVNMSFKLHEAVT